ncbi:uncharacterized protein LOC142559819 [Dermacentor variabilis]|uniref:uncharacterized protein LOC142559819 n=1 Tax=Dermacentor variabilis TaxID=34621 RepID=UPI003F5B7403
MESGSLKKANCFDLAAAWFGPTLYGSVAHVTAADERRAVDDFLRALLGDVRRAVGATSWTDETTRRAMVRRLGEMSVVTSQEPEEASSGALSEVWSSSAKEFIDILTAPTTKRISEGGEAWRFYEGEGRLVNPYRGLLYRYLSNTLTVTHAATASPLFYADYSGGGVLSAASFGGLATAFLEAALRMFDKRGIRIDEGEAMAWMSPRAERQLYRRFQCSSVIGENMLQVASLRVAWEAYKNAWSRGDSSTVEALDILDSYGNALRYTSHQLFFLTYCRRFCSTGTGCNSAVRSLPDLGSVFGCAKRHAEEDDLSQCRFFT